MRSPRFLLPVYVALTLALVIGGPAAPVWTAAAGDLPSRLTDEEFWKLSSESSEPDGYFQSDNLLSNEIVFARLVPQLASQAKPGGVYLGVGPEQNFTYIAAIKPGMAFITDIRRGNLHLQLMYKALFELSADRAEFLSRLFTKPRPANLTASTSVTDLMTAYWDVFTLDEAAYAKNLDAIQQHLTRTHKLPLSQADLDGIARVYRTFWWYGPSINYSASTALPPPGRMGAQSYWDLMVQTDQNGQGLSYLGSEDRFRVMKELESRNLLVPVVGNFSGPKALRAVGAYIRSRGATVTAFYLSNVESYLRREGAWPAFCANVATMPLDDGSVYIRPSGMGRGTFSVVVQPGAATTVTRDGRPPLQFIQFFPGTPPAGAPGPELQSGLIPIAAEVKANCASGVR